MKECEEIRKNLGEVGGVDSAADETQSRRCQREGRVSVQQDRRASAPLPSPHSLSSVITSNSESYGAVTNLTVITTAKGNVITE